MDIHSTQPNETLFVPELVSLLVHPETRTDQKTVDAVLRHLWKNRPEIVSELAYWERMIRDPGMHGKACAKVGFYLREEAVKEIKIPETRLGLLDIIFEASRRLRKAQGLGEIPILGKSLAPSREGSYPALINQEISRTKDGSSYFGMTQEMADAVCKEVYEQEPRLIFDFCEQTRRSVSTPEITSGFHSLISKVRNEKKLPTQCNFAGELHTRLNAMCQISSDKIVKEAF